MKPSTGSSISSVGNLAEWLRRKIRNLLGSARAGSSPADISSVGNLAEWLRRKIRNLLGSALAGSSPAVVEIFVFLIKQFESLRQVQVGTKDKEEVLRMSSNSCPFSFVFYCRLSWYFHLFEVHYCLNRCRTHTLDMCFIGSRA
ncbi:uncharacterized protein ZBAI_09252 [Zygosaccharomyces bailii ISA1307]|nr:uncharacterized protein ZBAI_09252 [Zygosaccharomyces bailii ISA1307]